MLELNLRKVDAPLNGILSVQVQNDHEKLEEQKAYSFLFTDSRRSLKSLNIVDFRLQFFLSILL